MAGGIARGKQQTDSTHVLAKIRVFNRVLDVEECLQHTLNCLALVAPIHSSADQVDGSDARLEESHTPLGKERRVFAGSIGVDDVSIFTMVFRRTIPCMATGNTNCRNSLAGVGTKLYLD